MLKNNNNIYIYIIIIKKQNLILIVFWNIENYFNLPDGQSNIKKIKKFKIK